MDAADTEHGGGWQPAVAGGWRWHREAGVVEEGCYGQKGGVGNTAAHTAAHTVSRFRVLGAPGAPCTCAG
jgi:hypothetical protein